MMRRLLAIFPLTVVVAAMLASLVVVSAAAATGTVNGSVTRLGSAVVDAKVVIRSQSDSSYGRVAYTDKQGTFSFSGAPLGGVNVRAYDGKEQLLVTGKGVLQYEGEVISLVLEIVP